MTDKQPASTNLLAGLRDCSDFPIPIIDAHHHLWDLSTGRYPSKQGHYDKSFFLGDYRKVCRDYQPADLAQDLAGYHIIGTVHIQAGRDESEQLAETAWLERMQAAFGLPSVIVGHVVFTQRNCAEILAGHAASPLVRGVRAKPVTSAGPGQSIRGAPGTMQDEAWLRNFSLLERHNLSWDMRVPYWHLVESAAVAAAFPRIRMVLNHAGLPLDRSEQGLSIWRAGLEALADQPNVVMKISELGLPNGVWDVPSNIQIVREAVAIFGADRVMFASNLPVSTLSTDFAGIMSVMREALNKMPEADLHKFFHQNAVKFYRITGLSVGP
ncbi:amidohydrolase [Acidisphaera sp. L21]|uniref:amidohydrolase family protein n=1 Tax=Acidisphaera sp. L21 TaxID=1641851 RepID=UPI00131D798F|nr:amidohydrolase family protein [Acidisphaera sp. L21]